MDKKFSIITVNFHSEPEVIGCFQSVLKQTQNNKEVELILVSNSPLLDDFKKKLNELDSDINIHQNQKNLGFAKACNKGAEIASGEYLFFLNPDTLFLNDVLKELEKCYLHNQHTGILGPQTAKLSGETEASAKNHLSKSYFISIAIPLLKPFLDQKKLAGHFLPNKTQSVPVLNGHALFVNQYFFHEIGGMDPELFMYWEENDLCLRTQKVGKKVIYCKEARVLHVKGTSTSPFFLKMEIEKHRSQKKFIDKHYPHLSFFNRIMGIIAYSWRATLFLFSFNKKKINQFWALFFWYSFRYK